MIEYKSNSLAAGETWTWPHKRGEHSECSVNMAKKQNINASSEGFI